MCLPTILISGNNNMLLSRRWIGKYIGNEISGSYERAIGSKYVYTRF